MTGWRKRLLRIDAVSDWVGFCAIIIRFFRNHQVVDLPDPAPHIGQIYDLTGPESADLDHYARVFSEALGRPIRYRDVPLPAWSERLRQSGFSEHLVRHLSAMAELTRQGRYDRMTDTMRKLTGEAPTNMRDFVKLHAAEFKQRGAAHS